VTNTVARVSVEELLTELRSCRVGLTADEAAARLAASGPNVIHTHRVNALAVLGRQLRSPLLLLLASAAALSYFVGDSSQSVIIGVILVVSIGLTSSNEYRAERTAADLHDRLRHHTAVLRDGVYVRCDVTQLVRGDVVKLATGQTVPADVRLLVANGLALDESILSGESTPVDKTEDAIAYMGTIVAAGDGVGVVFATGMSAEFGRIAEGLNTRAPETAFQIGLRRFSYLLLWVAVALMVGIVVINLFVHRSLLDTALFALAIAVGITPQLLPAVVSTSLAAGARRLTAIHVLVKRLVCIEDLGDVDVLVTDKTGTLTDGTLAFLDAVDASGTRDQIVLRFGVLATDIDPARGGVGANALDAALWNSVDANGLIARTTQLSVVPFDHVRRATTVLVDDGGDRWVVVKGAPEQVLGRCSAVPEPAHATLAELFAAGRRVVAVARRSAPGLVAATADEGGLTLCGFLYFADEPKPAAAEAISRLSRLRVDVKVATGDNAEVAVHVCERLGLAVKGVLTGDQLAGMGPARYADALRDNTVFARVSPEQKADLIRSARGKGRCVAFLGDGVNDALALHAADVGISVDSATDIAKDAADVILLEKDLNVLASGVTEGRRIFANTIKYVLMGTSSNFGNMFSAAAASALLTFLPMLPSQILLNNLLYDSSQLAIPTDRVDEEQLRAPSHWDIGFIRRFMVRFGLISSLFDSLTFALLLGVLHAAPTEFRTGWFIESLATQTLVIFIIRTHRVPFFRSRSSWPLTVAALSVVAVGVLITLSPWSPGLGFERLPLSFFVALAGLTAAYMVLAEFTKATFYREALRHRRPPVAIRTHGHRVRRRAAGFSHGGSGATPRRGTTFRVPLP
jgi:Mg2+-importing ATPase